MRKSYVSFLIMLLLLFAIVVGCSSGNEESSGSTNSEPASSSSESTSSEDATEENKTIDTLQIGVVLATSGALAQTGTWTLEGHEAAAKQINDNGGVEIGGTTYEVEIVHYDSEGRAESATAATEKLINQDKVPVIIGTSISSETAAMIPIAERSKTPLVTFVAASDILTQQGAQFFTQAAPANKNYVDAGTMTMEQMGMSRVALIYVDDAWGQSYAGLYPPLMEEAGIEIVTTEKFAAEQTEFMTMLNKIKGENPDGVLLAAETELAVPLLKQLWEVMPGMKVMETGGTIPEELVELVPSVADGTVILSRSGAETDEIKAFKDFFNSIYNYEANPFVYSGYDGINLVVDAMQRIGSITDKEALNEAIRGAEFTGLIGTYTFNEIGENNLLGNRAVIKGGEITYQTVDQPLP